MSPVRWGDPTPEYRPAPDPSLDMELHVEACKNARLLSRICELLERGQNEEALRQIRSQIYLGLPVPELPIDYDPDIHGWPWEDDREP